MKYRRDKPANFDGLIRRCTPAGRLECVTEQPDSGKGGPTRSRKEAEAARRAEMKRPKTRKEQAQQSRKLRNSQRERQQAALSGKGTEADLPLRDRGPVRALVRDFVDRRRTIAEFMLPLLLVILVLSFFKEPALVSAVFTTWIALIFAIVIDEVLLVVMLKRELKRRFEPSQIKGATFYAILRTTQMRRFRLPTPAINLGEPLRDRY